MAAGLTSVRFAIRKLFFQFFTFIKPAVRIHLILIRIRILLFNNLSFYKKILFGFWLLKAKSFSVDILSLRSGSVDLHIFEDLDPDSKNVADSTDPDPKHWKTKELQRTFFKTKYLKKFLIRIDDPELNGELESVPQVFSNSLSSLLPVLKPSQSTKDPSQEIAQGSETDQVITTSKSRSKVKKKVKSSSQVISFEDSISTPELGEEAIPESPFSPFSSQPTDDSFLFSRKQEEPEEDFSSVPSRNSRSPKRTDSFSSAGIQGVEIKWKFGLKSKL